MNQNGINCIVIFILTSILCTNSTMAQDTTYKSLIFEYLFDNDTGNYAFNSAFNQLHGQLMNGPVHVTGFHEKALEFDDTDDFILVGDVEPELDLQHYTAMSWVYPYSRGSDSKRIEIMEKNHMMWQNIRRENGLLRVGGRYINAMNQEQRFIADSDSAIPLNKWTHITSVNNGKTLKSYINGREAGSVDVPDSVMVSDEMFTIGSKQTSSQTEAYFHGMLDEIRVFSEALSVNEIKYWMNKNTTSVKLIEEEMIKVYPNPATNYITINVGKFENTYIRIVLKDITNRVIHELYQGKPDEQLLNTSLSGISRGAYLLEINSGTEVLVFRIINN